MELLPEVSTQCCGMYWKIVEEYHSAFYFEVGVPIVLRKQKLLSIVSNVHSISYAILSKHQN